ncbi:hypothetical protein MCA1612 [Methylococcus capsulatus str. Bath]|uniref:Uncharacterized protein n=1 Tax=Methylococcus capsulatus (strain ATCC 33009 / NCIMB 11132 / Bath) TaxID=243233 RepID=Q607Y8_METCA|nr:hypothetical protein [Methylococcus capsulatus]AAU92391.1 hypothetical protein MCA1612 [Methylococcus capsulatus str. Bath]
MGLFSALDEFLFGPPGEVGGLIGTPTMAVFDAIESSVELISENPGKAALVAAGTLATGGIALAAAPAIASAAGAAGMLVPQARGRQSAPCLERLLPMPHLLQSEAGRSLPAAAEWPLAPQSLLALARPRAPE